MKNLTCAKFFTSTFYSNFLLRVVCSSIRTCFVNHRRRISSTEFNVFFFVYLFIACWLLQGRRNSWTGFKVGWKASKSHSQCRWVFLTLNTHSSKSTIIDMTWRLNEYTQGLSEGADGDSTVVRLRRELQRREKAIALWVIKEIIGNGMISDLVWYQT